MRQTRNRIKLLNCFVIAALLACSHIAHAQQWNHGKVLPSVTPDVREQKPPLALQKGDWLAVPIPTANPTTGSGLIGVTAYFWGQTDEQKKVQPPSVSGLGVMYTDSESWLVGLGQTAYWDEDRWRISAVIGAGQLNLPLISTDELGSEINVNWEIEGTLAYALVSRKLFERFYLGFQGRHLSFEQRIVIDIPSSSSILPTKIQAASGGLQLIRDTRDSTTNARSGNLLSVGALHTVRTGSSDNSYESYDLAFRSYHELSKNIVLAWRGEVCERTRNVPLWDACRLGLRGFAATRYMGRSSRFAEIEARWKLSERWGIVAFGGAGKIYDSIFVLDESDIVPGYGVGLRFLVQEAKQINLRLDYGRSNDSDAIYFFVGEAF